jgi:hypothetical protein
MTPFERRYDPEPQRSPMQTEHNETKPEAKARLKRELADIEHARAKSNADYGRQIAAKKKELAEVGK